MLPFDSEHLTEPEKAVQRMQEHRNCMSCVNAQIHQRGGARTCIEPEAPLPSDVMCGAVICIYYQKG